MKIKLEKSGLWKILTDTHTQFAVCLHQGNMLHILMGLNQSFYLRWAEYLRLCCRSNHHFSGYIVRLQHWTKASHCRLGAGCGVRIHATSQTTLTHDSTQRKRKNENHVNKKCPLLHPCTASLTSSRLRLLRIMGFHGFEPRLLYCKARSGRQPGHAAHSLSGDQDASYSWLTKQHQQTPASRVTAELNQHLCDTPLDVNWT